MAAYQGNLFSPYRTLKASQAKLFQAGEGECSNLACVVCGEHLVRTAQDYLACPLGHGKLIDESPEPDGRWFEDAEGGEE